MIGTVHVLHAMQFLPSFELSLQKALAKPSQPMLGPRLAYSMLIIYYRTWVSNKIKAKRLACRSYA